MQAQGHLRVLGRVRTRLVEVDLVEGDLLRPLARHLLELAGPDPEVPGREGVHVVTGRGAVQHVGLEHGVVRHPGHRDAVVREHAHVVLEVVADLGPVRILKERAQRAEHPFLAELVRGRRDSGARTGCTPLRRARPRERPRPPSRPRSRGWWSRCRRRRLRPAAIRSIHRSKASPVSTVSYDLSYDASPAASAGGPPSRLHFAARRRPVQELAEERTELEAPVERLESAPVRGAGAKLLGLLLECHVAADRHEPP